MSQSPKPDSPSAGALRKAPVGAARYFEKNIEQQWYQQPTWLWAFSPLVPVFSSLASRKKQRDSVCAEPFAVPVIVVGNITAGGTGKTPLVLAITQYLSEQGLSCVVVSRGYGGTFSGVQHVCANSKGAINPAIYGDEPSLLAEQGSCPVVVGADRAAAVNFAIQNFSCDVVISDDGLQHYRMHRDIEIAVVDAQRGFGNAHLMPLGPLREPIARLSELDFVVQNGEVTSDKLTQTIEEWVPAEKLDQMTLQPGVWRHVKSGRAKVLDDLDLTDAVAIAGIGNPQRFLQTLRGLGYKGDVTVFPDHYAYQRADLDFARDKILLMTSKDAIKCKDWVGDNAWYLEVHPVFKNAFLTELFTLLQHKLQHNINQNAKSP